MLLCCWLAAVGAGLLKSEEILEGVARLRISNDIEFEEENFIAMIKESREVSSSTAFYLIYNIPILLNARLDKQNIQICSRVGWQFKQKLD